MSRGHQRERDVIDLLREEGYVCVRAAGSLGPVDVMAMRRPILDQFTMIPQDQPGRKLLVEVKSTRRGPYHGFPPKDRAEMLEIAEQAGAEAWLAWWPPCKPGQRKLDMLKWLPSRCWPK